MMLRRLLILSSCALLRTLPLEADAGYRWRIEPVGEIARPNVPGSASMGGIATITAIVLGFAVNHEIIHWYQLVGALLILIGACGVNYISLKKSRKTGEEF